MAEFYMNLFENEHEGTNRPHFKLLFKLDGIEHECPFWPAKDEKKGYVGKCKPRKPKEPVSDVTQADADKAWDQAKQAFKPRKEPIQKPPKVEFNDPVPF